MRRISLGFAVSCLLIAFACGGEEEAPATEGPTAADSVQAAEQAYDPASYDTISWETHQAELDRGAVVWRISCTKCHGNAGRGDGNFVAAGDTLRPPSLLTPDWRFAGDEAGLRKQIYTGTVEGMPHWGLVGLKYRDVDAVATYILEIVRLGVES